MNIQNKILIFDFDGVFYSGEHKFDKVKECLDDNKRKFLPNLTDEEYETLVDENPQWLDAETGNKIVELLYKLKNKYKNFNISTQAFIDWQNKSVYPIVIDENQIVDCKFMSNLCEKYSVYIVSNSSQNHIKYYMKKFGVKDNLFKEIISNNFEESGGNKGYYYLQIMEKEKVNPENIYVFGDVIKTDLIPAKELGMNVFLIQNTNHINDIVNSVIY